MRGLLGKKIGMTQIFDSEGHSIPVTVFKAGPCFVTQVKTNEIDGLHWDAIQHSDFANSIILFVDTNAFFLISSSIWISFFSSSNVSIKLSRLFIAIQGQ